MSEPAKDILMTIQGELRFCSDGRWTHAGVPFTHSGVELYFSRHLRWSEDQKCFVVASEARCVPVVVEDCPFVIRTIVLDANAPRNKSTGVGIMLRNDDDWEPFIPETLSTKESAARETIYYCRSVEKHTKVRLLRPAVQALLPHIHADGDAFVFSFHDVTHPIQREVEGK